MEKQQWEKMYNLFTELLSDFLFSYSEYKSGKNKKIRSDAERIIKNLIRKADYHIKNNREIYELCIGGENVDEYGKILIYDEIIKPNYFESDISKLLILIDEKIKNF